MRVVSLLFHDVYRCDPGESGFRSRAADSYKLSDQEFDAQLEGVAAARTDRPIVIAGRCQPGDASACPFLISVDDGGLSYYSVVADRLEARGWRGHCFVSTDFIGREGFLDSRQLRELDARGHVIGSHSASHPGRFSVCTSDDMCREWTDSREVLQDLLGHSVTVASVPGGYFSAAVADAASQCGLRTLFTSEPTTSVVTRGETTVIGRFVIRRGDRANRSRQLVEPSPWARASSWMTWNAKGLIKPVLGSAYPRLADWARADWRPGRST